MSTRTDNGNAVETSDDLADILEPIKAKHAELGQRIALLRAEIGALFAEQQRYAKVLRAATPPDTVVRTPRKGGKPATTKARVAPWREEEIVKFLADSETPLSATELADKMGWNVATMSIAVKQARANGLIRMAGRGHHNSTLWAAMPS